MLRFWIVGLRTFVGATCLFAALQAAEAQTATWGAPLYNLESKLCLDVQQNQDQGRVVMATCGQRSERPYQAWSFANNLFSNPESGRCLEVKGTRSGQRVGSGTAVVIGDCPGGAHYPGQTWIVHESGYLNAATGLCLDVAEARSGGLAVVGTCGNEADRPFQAWELKGGYWTFDEYVWLTSHNSHTNYSDARWSMANQSMSLVGQLDYGVRGLMLDVWDFDGNAGACGASFFTDCGEPGVHLCHGGCYGAAGFHYALPRQTFATALDEIAIWLEKNTDVRDVVTIILEDKSEAANAVHDTIAASRAAQFVFDPWGSGSAWDVKNRGWPTLDWMKANNKRLIITTRNSAHFDSAYMVNQKEITVENTWSIGDTGNNYECKTRSWGSLPLTTDRPFVMNHFRNTPTAGMSARDNNFDHLQERWNDYCQPATGKERPTWLALDFVELGAADEFIAWLDPKSALRKTSTDVQSNIEASQIGLVRLFKNDQVAYNERGVQIHNRGAYNVRLVVLWWTEKQVPGGEYLMAYMANNGRYQDNSVMDPPNNQSTQTLFVPHYEYGPSISVGVDRVIEVPPPDEISTNRPITVWIEGYGTTDNGFFYTTVPADFSGTVCFASWGTIFNPHGSKCE